MGDNLGFDDQFNDGLFHTSLHNSQLTRPRMWPKSVSEMRHHTYYGGQGMPGNHDTGYSTYMAQRPYIAAPHGDRRRHSWLWTDAH